MSTANVLGTIRPDLSPLDRHVAVEFLADLLLERSRRLLGLPSPEDAVEVDPQVQAIAKALSTDRLGRSVRLALAGALEAAIGKVGIAAAVEAGDQDGDFPCVPFTLVVPTEDRTRHDYDLGLPCLVFSDGYRALRADGTVGRTLDRRKRYSRLATREEAGEFLKALFAALADPDAPQGDDDDDDPGF